MVFRKPDFYRSRDITKLEFEGVKVQYPALAALAVMQAEEILELITPPDPPQVSRLKQLGTNLLDLLKRPPVSPGEYRHIVPSGIFGLVMGEPLDITYFIQRHRPDQHPPAL